MWERWRTSSWVWAPVLAALALIVRVPEEETSPASALGAPAEVRTTAASAKQLEPAPDRDAPKVATRWHANPPKYAAGANPKAVVLSAFAPVRALLEPRVRVAYEAAVDSSARFFTTCSLRWTVLAAVGAVESANGAHHPNAVVFSKSGRVHPLIIGPVLDGTKGTAAIRDSDGGALDQDATWDRAVGPMQFLPSTWRTGGRDGNGDGIADPHSIDDAALAAAHYLCANRRDLRIEADLDAALFSYNRSLAYVAAVRSQLSLFDAEFLPVISSALSQSTSTSTAVSPPSTTSTSTALPPTTTTVPPTSTAVPPPSTTSTSTTVPSTSTTSTTTTTALPPTSTALPSTSTTSTTTTTALPPTSTALPPAAPTTTLASELR